MSSSRHYQAGTVHYLDFDEFAPKGSEMVKGRGVVIVSPTARRHDDLVIALPLSTRPPETHKKYAVHIIHDELNGTNGGSWVKCDMPITVSTTRLSDYRRPKYAGQNDIPAVSINGDELRHVREAMIRALGAKEIFQRLRWEYETARAIIPLSPAKPIPKPTPPNSNGRVNGGPKTRANRPVPAKKK